MTWLTHLRTLAIGFCAFALFTWFVTQMLARAWGYAPELGGGLIVSGGGRLYAPWTYLQWTVVWARYAPSLLVLAICLTFVCALAAYAVAIVIAKLEPIRLTPPSPWRDLASWAELGDYGLLRAEGCALGAVRRHALAPHRVVRCAAGGCVFLGEPRHTDDALRAALASWHGPLVLIDARGEIADGIGRADVWRFAPGRSDTLGFNPLLAIRGGLDAWGDARRLATALLSGGRASAPDQAIDAFALLMLDQLICGPVETRTLTALHRRLLDPIALVAELCARWVHTPADSAAPATWEMVRAARSLRAEPDHAMAHYALIDRALAGFADAGLARATGAHHLNLAQFISAPAPRVLVLSLQGVAGQHAAALFHGLLAQLAALHASAGGQDLLLAIEAEAARILVDAVDVKQPLPASAVTRIVVQAADVAHAERLGDGLGAIVAIGPQADASAAALSRRGGRCTTYDPIPHRIPRWRRLLFPTWVSREVERLPEAALKAAGPDEAFLVVPQRKPAPLKVLVGGGATTYVAVGEPAAHDWSAPPLAAAPLAQDAPNVISAPTPPGPTSAKLRRVLTRKSATPSSKGAPHP
jgi:hypothetical protein